MTLKPYYKFFGILLLIYLLFSSVFYVDQRQSAVIFQFGEAVKTIENAGLHWKLPFIQNVDFFEKRLLHVNADTKELTAADGKRIIVDAFAKFIINDPVRFYKTVHNYQGVQIRLNKILESSMRKVIGRVPLTAMLTGERSNVMLNIRDQVNQEAKDFGVNVIDVRIMRAELPKENSAAIYRRMISERMKEANQIRAEGQEEGARVMSKADKESTILLAEAYKTSQILKGDGDSEAAKILNKAGEVDAEFYKFYKSLDVYKDSFEKGTSFVLPPESKFLKHLNLGK